VVVTGTVVVVVTGTVVVVAEVVVVVSADTPIVPADARRTAAPKAVAVIFSPLTLITCTRQS